VLFHGRVLFIWVSLHSFTFDPQLFNVNPFASIAITLVFIAKAFLTNVYTLLKNAKTLFINENPFAFIVNPFLTNVYTLLENAKTLFINDQAFAFIAKPFATNVYALL
jgi:hypothetical protein